MSTINLEYGRLYTVLYCNVLDSTVLYCTVLYRTIMYRTVLYYNKKVRNTNPSGLILHNKIRKFAHRQRTNRQTENSSKTEATLILCGSSGERANIIINETLQYTIVQYAAVQYAIVHCSSIVKTEY